MSNGDAEPPVSPACCSRSDHVNLMPFSLLRARLPAARAFGAAACLANLLVCAPSAGAGSLGLRYQSTRLIYTVQCIWNNHHPTEPLLLEFQRERRRFSTDVHVSVAVWGEGDGKV